MARKIFMRRVSRGTGAQTTIQTNKQRGQMTHKGVLVVIVLVALWLLDCTHAYRQTLHVTKDSRSQFFIENFGFAKNGHFYMNVSNFEVCYTTLLYDNNK